MQSVIAIAEAVRRGERTARSVAEDALARIDRRDGALRAFLTVSKDELLAQADAVDDKRARGGKLGPLAGVPIALKDALCTRGIRTTCASKALEGVRSRRAWRRDGLAPEAVAGRGSRYRSGRRG